MDPHAPETPAALPQLDELPVVRRNGLDPEAVGEAFKRFEDHIVSLQDELRSLDAAILEARAARASVAEHSPEGGSAARTESLNLIRAAAEFAELLERDGREEAQKRLRAAEDELHSQRLKLVEREAELDRERRSIEARRDEVLERALEDARARSPASRRSRSRARRAARPSGSSNGPAPRARRSFDGRRPRPPRFAPSPASPLRSQRGCPRRRRGRRALA
jgi:prefoldin subunit 5